MNQFDDSNDDFIDPTPREILLRRAEIHRARGDLDKACWLEEEARLLAGGEADDDPFETSLFDFGLPKRFCELMLRQGVWQIGELVEWRAGMVLRLDGMNRGKLRHIERRLRRFGLRLRRGRWRKEKWFIDGEQASAEDDAPIDRVEGEACILPFTSRKIIELWEHGVPQREITSRFNLGRNTHYKVWEIIQMEQRRRTAEALGRHLGEPDWLVDVGTERLEKTTRWQLVIRVEEGAREKLRGLDTWESRPVRVVERQRQEVLPIDSGWAESGPSEGPMSAVSGGEANTGQGLDDLAGDVDRPVPKGHDSTA